MIRFWRQWRDRVQVKKDEKATNFNRLRQCAIDAVEIAAKEMQEKPCAIRSMKNCTDECVHFKRGSVSLMPDLQGGEPWIIREYPGCKLWQ